MLKLRTPNDETLDRLIASCQGREFTYAEVGATVASLPAGYRVGHQESEVGRGEGDFAYGIELLLKWRQFDLPWVRLHASGRADAGMNVLVIAKIMTLTTVNPCQVVYLTRTEDEHEARFAYACGTLPGHDVQGEERFQLVWDKSSDRILFQIDSFSRPYSWLAKAFAFLARRKQRQFRHESALRLKQLIAQQRDQEVGTELANCVR